MCAFVRGCYAVATITVIFIGALNSKDSSEKQVQLEQIVFIIYYMGCIIAAMSFAIHATFAILESEFLQFTNQLLRFFDRE